MNIEDMATFCKRKGFVYQDSEIYGSLAGFWDFGPLGVELKNNIKNEWWKYFVHKKHNVVGMDGSIITHKKIWEASGHVDCFADILIECKKCNKRYRADVLIEDVLKIKTEGMTKDEIAKKVKEIKCTSCKGELGEPNQFNLMFETNVGPVAGNTSYLRPETAQLIFADFRLIIENSRQKLPFGIAQIGKAFRNEISPRDFLFRSREFEQMEMEFFVHPDKINECPEYEKIKDFKVELVSAKDMKQKNVKFADIAKLTSKWHTYWLAENYLWFLSLGVKEENLRLREHTKDELAHYAGACFDIEYNFPFGWKEIHGNADRRQFDIEQHLKVSKKDITVYDEDSKQKVVPYVASEPSQGVERAFLAFMFDAYSDDKERGNVVLRLHPKLAPIKAAVFPLVNKPELLELSQKIFDDLIEELHVVMDTKGSIGRRYARNDEIGTPFCITIDFESLDDKSVTIRYRDTTEQIRVKVDGLKETLQKLLDGQEFVKFGKLIG